MTRFPLVAILALMIPVSALAQAPRPATLPARPDTTACIVCHRTGDEERLRKPVQDWANDVHAAAGLGCESCHGGDPTRVKGLDQDASADHAMDPAKGFKPPPDRLEVPQFCARCHSDAAYMKRFNPQLRVDQLTEYRTSVHGKKNAAGDEKPATCIDCHGIHGIRAVNNPASPVFATNVPKTCAKCHANAELMAPYKIPTNQYADWQQSVHAQALLEQGDLGAPACNDCHGNHGATPPQAASVQHVCGQCHAREAGLYQASFKNALFEKLKVPQCIVCHSNHRILHPTPELFQSRSGPQVSAGRVTGADPFAAELGDLAPGGKVSASWRNALSPHLEDQDPRYRHQVEITAEAMRPIVLDATVRPGLDTAPAPARTGEGGPLEAVLAIQPVSGVPVEGGDAILYRLELTAPGKAAVRNVRVRDLPGRAVHPIAGSACLKCHKLGDSCDVAAETMYRTLSDLDRGIRRGEGLLREAELAGMEVSRPKFDLKNKGTTAAVEARALIHSFDPPRLMKRGQEGLAAAEEARKAGIAALDDLQFRRKGLAVSLILVLLVLTGLGLKIRDVDRRRRESGDGSAP